MLEGNVLVKKYRGGRQEDYLKKDFALFWDFTSRHLCYFDIEGFYVEAYLDNLYF